MKRFLSPALVLAVITLCSFPVSADDLTLISKMTSNGKSSTATQYLSETKMRNDDGAGNDLIFDYENSTMTSIEHKKKRYWQATTAEMAAQMEQMASVLEGSPLAGRLLGGAMDVKVEPTDETKEIAGYKCRMVVMTMGEGFTFEMCVTKDLETPISYYEARKSMTAMMGPMAARFEKMYDEMAKLGGLPLENNTRSKLMGRSMETQSVVTEVKIGPLAAGTFDIPAGYKQKKSPFE